MSDILSFWIEEFESQKGFECKYNGKVLINEVLPLLNELRNTRHQSQTAWKAFHNVDEENADLRAKLEVAEAAISYKGYYEQLVRFNNENQDLRTKLEESEKEAVKSKEALIKSNQLYKNMLNLACDNDRLREDEMYKRIKLEKQVEGLQQVIDRQKETNLVLIDKLKEAEEEIVQYVKTTELQLNAAARATKLYNDKHGTNIGLIDFEKGEVFLMEEYSELQAKLEVAEKRNIEL